jgi:hypothetical protein
MIKTSLRQKVVILFVTFASLWSANVFATLVLTINTYNANELSFSISGTFDADVVGDQTDWLALRMIGPATLEPM